MSNAFACSCPSGPCATTFPFRSPYRVRYPCSVCRIDDHEASVRWVLPEGARPRDMMPQLAPQPCEACGEPLGDHAVLHVAWNRPGEPEQVSEQPASG